MRVAFFTRYAERGASSRVRATQFAKALAAEGVEASFWPLLSDQYLGAKYSGRTVPGEVVKCYARRVWQVVRSQESELLWVEKELLPYVPHAFEALLLAGRRYVLDLDDAIFHNYDLAAGRLVREVLSAKIDRLMAGAALVTAGTSYLAQRARAAGALRVELLPSVIDLTFYPDPTLESEDDVVAGNQCVRIVWIGSPATVHYLELLRRPLQRVARELQLEVHVIGAAPPTWPSVKTVSVPWSVAEEGAAIRRCDVGIMPLTDGPWERGKCAYKLVQYMACGKPVIASPVGANKEIVVDGVNGFLASTEEQWVSRLLALAADSDLRRVMGRRGRAKVEAELCVQAVAPRFAALLREAAR